MEERVTLQNKSKFNNFCIRIHTKTCEDIKRGLSVAMKKYHAPEKLHLMFSGKMNKTMIQMIVDYKDKITSLDICVYTNKDMLLKHAKYLDRLSLSRGLGCTDDTMVRVCEAMLAKYAKNLKNLKVSHLRKNLRVPNLPKLKSLTLKYVDEEAAWNILEQCRPTITSLELIDMDMEYQPDNSNSPESEYEIPNIKHLSIITSNAFEFVESNAENLVTLNLETDPDESEELPEGFLWPDLPNLKELNLDGATFYYP